MSGYDYRLSPADDPDEELREQADTDFDEFLQTLRPAIRSALDTKHVRACFVEGRFKELEAERADMKAGV